MDEVAFQPAREFSVKRSEFEYNFDNAKSQMKFLTEENGNQGSCPLSLAMQMSAHNIIGLSG